MIRFSDFRITTEILDLFEGIFRQVGQLEVSDFTKPRGVRQRWENMITSIHSTLAISGSTLHSGQIFRLVQGKEIFASEAELIEADNMIRLYNEQHSLKGLTIKSFKYAHEVMLKDRIKENGKFRTKGVFVDKSSACNLKAVAGGNVNQSIKELFHFLKTDKNHWLIKSCIAHYGIVAIQPYVAGNGRMGRFWQQILLKEKVHSMFGHMAVEEVLLENKDQYFSALKATEKTKSLSPFVMFMLDALLRELKQAPRKYQVDFRKKDRMFLAFERFQQKHFSRKQYMSLFDIGTATASRDLAKAVKDKVVSRDKMSGTTACYQFMKNPVTE